MRTVINDRLIDAGELPLAVRDFGGDQPPLLLLHAEGGNLATMTTLARALRPNYRVITVDLRGHGRSGEGTWTWDAVLGDLAAMCVQMDLERPAVVGHSLGGMIATLWGQRHPEAPGVISLDGTPPPTDPSQLAGLSEAGSELVQLNSLLDQAAAAAGQVIDGDRLPDLVEREQMAARDMGANEKVWIEGFRRNLIHENGETSTRPSAATATQVRSLMASFDLTSAYAGTTCPSLIVLPTRDSPDQGAFAELYGAYRRWVLDQLEAVANATYIQLQDASHAMVIEQPTVLAGLITEFLTQPR
jgi:pimeloyl-ACP methyl ester carboxylesterase